MTKMPICHNTMPASLINDYGYMLVKAKGWNQIY